MGSNGAFFLWQHLFERPIYGQFVDISHHLYINTTEHHVESKMFAQLKFCAYYHALAYHRLGNPKPIQALLEGNGPILSRDQTSETSMFLVKWIDGTTGETSRAKVPEGELRTSSSKQLDQCFLNERKTQQERSVRSKRPELLRIEQIHDIKHHGEYLIGSLVTHCWFCCVSEKA